MRSGFALTWLPQVRDEPDSLGIAMGSAVGQSTDDLSRNRHGDCGWPAIHGREPVVCKAASRGRGSGSAGTRAGGGAGGDRLADRHASDHVPDRNPRHRCAGQPPSRGPAVVVDRLDLRARRLDRRGGPGRGPGPQSRARRRRVHSQPLAVCRLLHDVDHGVARDAGQTGELRRGPELAALDSSPRSGRPADLTARQPLCRDHADRRALRPRAACS